MKKSALIIGFVLTFAIFANAQSRQQIAVQIPFDFYVQNQKMTAGDYLIESVSRESNQSTLILRDKNGKAKGLMTTNLIELDKDRKSFTPTMIFNRYGEDYFLSEICNPAEELGFAVRFTKTEKLFSQKFGKPTQETVAINSAKK